MKTPWAGRCPNTSFLCYRPPGQPPITLSKISCGINSFWKFTIVFYTTHMCTVYPSGIYYCFVLQRSAEGTVMRCLFKPATHCTCLPTVIKWTGLPEMSKQMSKIRKGWDMTVMRRTNRQTLTKHASNSLQSAADTHTCASLSHTCDKLAPPTCTCAPEMCALPLLLLSYSS